MNSINLGGGNNGLNYIPNLQEITNVGNFTTNRILFGENADYQSIGKGTFDNGSGADGGISLFYTIGYELNW